MESSLIEYINDYAHAKADMTQNKEEEEEEKENERAGNRQKKKTMLSEFCFGESEVFAVVV